MKRIQFRASSIPAALFILCLISYGLLIPWLGFYWDDWPYSWFAHILGPLGFVKAFANDRPFLSLIYMITTPLFGDTPLAWQLFGILTRFLTAYALWWTLRKIWPQYLRQIAAVVFLFVVFPGFGQQWISVIYSQVFIILAAFIFSLGLTILAYQKPRWYWSLTLSAIICSVFSLFSTEYFFGIELLRPMLLWIVVGQKEVSLSKRAIRSVLHWMPYFLVWAGYAAYHVWLMQSSSYKGYQLQAFDYSTGGPRTTFIHSIQAIIDSIAKGGFAAWTQTANLFSFPFEASSTFLYILVCLFSFAVALFYFSKLNLSVSQEPDIQPKHEDRWGIQAIILGLAGILLGRLPSWAAGLEIGMTFPWDRFMVSMMLGSSLFVAGLIEFLIKTEKRKIYILAIVLAFSAAWQFQNANTFRRAWDSERNFFWQLTWRIPGLKPGTLLLTPEFSLQYYSDYSLSAPLNMIYAPNLSPSGSMPYLLLYTKARKDGSLPSLAPNTPVKFDYRAMTFTGNTSQTVVLYMPSPGCLRVMEPDYNDEHTMPDLPDELTEIIPLSHSELILSTSTNPAVPPAKWFGAEPPHTWCYYFAKAELAQQQRNWQKVVDLWNEAQSKGYLPQIPSERLPFIYAFAYTGQIDTALQLTHDIIAEEPKSDSGMCYTWNKISDNISHDSVTRKKINALYTELRCN
ncbi:MAG: hypothetical protein ABSE06_06545 [Anaerolineaceae bacterium]|jgi:hypothetical protein